jgi:hypothetical protein
LVKVQAGVLRREQSSVVPPLGMFATQQLAQRQARQLAL